MFSINFSGTKQQVKDQIDAGMGAPDKTDTTRGILKEALKTLVDALPGNSLIGSVYGPTNGESSGSFEIKGDFL